MRVEIHNDLSSPIPLLQASRNSVASLALLLQLKTIPAMRGVLQLSADSSVLVAFVPTPLGLNDSNARNLGPVPRGNDARVLPTALPIFLGLTSKPDLSVARRCSSAKRYKIIEHDPA